MIKRNAARCLRCKVVIESKYVHDYQSCNCGAISIDGGHEYLRHIGNRKFIEDLSEETLNG